MILLYIYKLLIFTCLTVSVNSLFCDKLFTPSINLHNYSLRYNNYYSITFGYINFIEN